MGLGLGLPALQSSGDSNPGARIGPGSGQVSTSTRPQACDSALTEPGRRLSARRTPDPALSLDPAGREPPKPRALAPGLPARNLPRAMAQPLVLPASAAARLTQGTQRGPSNGRLATEPLPPSQRRGHVTLGAEPRTPPPPQGRLAHGLQPFTGAARPCSSCSCSGLSSAVAPWGRNFRPQASSPPPPQTGILWGI